MGGGNHNGGTGGNSRSQFFSNRELVHANWRFSGSVKDARRLASPSQPLAFVYRSREIWLILRTTISITRVYEGAAQQLDLSELSPVMTVMQMLM
jgi:hypothetical protein